MRTAFIIFSIFAAVVLLVRFAAPAAVPKYNRFERITQNALLRKIHALGKRCAVTEHGLGVGIGNIKLRKIIDVCKRRVCTEFADDWQYSVYNGSDVLLRAFTDAKKAARNSFYCGHVGKYPRIFLFCDELVKNSGLELTSDMLLSAISAFEENAKLSVPERKILCGMLKLCLIGYLCGAALDAVSRADIFDKGANDGKNGIVDLDYLFSDDYVCGLKHGCTDGEKNAIDRLFEYNDVDIASADMRRRRLLSQVYLAVNSVLRSIEVIDSCSSDIYVEARHEQGKRYAKVFNIVFPSLIALYAVFTCIFATPKYVALFSVAAVITYGVMRVPVLLFSPASGALFFTTEKIMRKMFYRKKRDINVRNRLLLSETAYFGSEPQYLESAIHGADIKLMCDNRGEIKIKCNSTIDSLYIGIQSDGTETSLSQCDGVIERHRATYRVCTDGVELCAEIIVPIDCTPTVLIRLSVINRSDEDRSVNLTGAVVRNFPKETCHTEDIRGGAIALCDNPFALSLFGGQYGGDLDCYCKTGALSHGDTEPALIGKKTLHLARFSKVTTYMTVVYASRVQAENMIEYISDPLYFFRASEGATVFCELDKTGKLPDTQRTQSACRKETKRPRFVPPALPEKKYVCSLPFGGVTEDCISVENDAPNSINNTLDYMTLNQYGIQTISIGECETAPQDRTFFPRAFVAVGEDGVLWSPTVKPIGNGINRADHYHGYTEYTCAYNGAVCIQRCFASKNNQAIFIEVALHNTTDIKRRFDIMFSALFSNAETQITENGVVAEKRKSRLLLRALNEQAEYTPYREGYFVYGKIDRASGFRTGGCTPAPTASVCKTVESNETARVVFCLGCEDRVSQINNLSAVDDIFCGVKSFFGRLGRIMPKTDDNILNISYRQALYRAYSAFASRKAMKLYDECFLWDAAKYVVPSAVKKRIYEIIGAQKQDGQIGTDYSDCLQAVHSIIEYVRFTGDDRIFADYLPFNYARGKAIKDTVYNHLVRAVGYLLSHPLPNKTNIVQNLRQYKSLLYVLRFFEDKIRKNDFAGLYKQRLADVVNKYSAQVGRLTANTFFSFSSIADAFMCAELLFDLGLNEKAYNIIKFNNPIERVLHYGKRTNGDFDYFCDGVAAAVYFVTVTEKLFGVKFRGKTLKINPHTALNTPKIAFDIYGKSKDVHVTVEDTAYVGSWKMRIKRIVYPVGSVNIRNINDDIVFYRDGSM
ncbi:MAG: hypothetical protein J1F71_00840 [Clostridiales bacterium]|nr:hypothetical protein [Clostridiales bacterium]